MLGLHRDGALIPWDDDADLMIFAEQEKAVAALAQEVALAGHRLVFDVSHILYEGP